MRKGPKLGLLVRPIAGRVKNNTKLASRLALACAGAQREAKTQKPCWEDDQNTSDFIVLR